ncbi:MAG: thiamine pyrophosphate-binding protein [Methylophilaceae bacterium]|nr:thiamine pyrophosphate-binding protein [Methylophilaceae bacterium]
MKVGDYVIHTLANLGIDKMFVVYGAANGDLIDAFTRTDKTEYVAVMHEQAGGFAAEAYAKVKKLPGVAIATSGPGGMNLLTPMGNCFYDSTPCIFITGQIHSQFLRPDQSIRQVGFQECDIVAMAKPVTKYAVMINKAEDIRYELEKSIYLSQEGRPGPILLDIPLNIQKMEIDPDKLDGFDIPRHELKYDLDEIDRQIIEILAEIQKAKRPAIMVGMGVRIADAADELRELGEILNVPVYPTWNALDVVTSDYKQYGGRIGTYGGAGRNFGIQNSDLLLAIGSRISGRITGGNIHSFAREAKKIVVDVDPSLLQRKLQQVPFDINVLCDAKIFLKRIILKLQDSNFKVPDFSEWTKKCIEWKVKYNPVKKEFFDQKENCHPYAFMRMLSEEMSAKGILIGDCGGNIVVSNHSFETKYGQRNLTNNGNSPMGFSFSGALGAWFAEPTKEVVCTIGDGGFNMNIQELQTIKNYGIKVKTFILNNHIYGITKAYQETNFQGRAEACGPKGYNPPNFINIAKAYGVKTVEILNHNHMRELIREVLDSDEAVVCDVNCHEFHTYEPRIFGWKTPIEDMYPYLPREEFKSNMIIEPLEDWENPVYPDIVK